MEQFCDESQSMRASDPTLNPQQRGFFGIENDANYCSAMKTMRSLDIATKQSSKNQKKRLAGQKSREKKKNYIKTMEEKVKQLSRQLQHYDQEMSKCKDKLVQALKTNNSNSNEHAYTFAQLERNALAEDPDLDRIDLLIDLIRNRIGASGKERQANINYNFKQIVNSMFPAIYRYLFNTAEQSLDIFSPDSSSDKLLSQPNTWTHELYSNIRLQDQQVDQLNQAKEQLKDRRREAVSHMRRLDEAKEKVKRQGQFFEKILGSIRQAMTPVQCALMTVFAEKNKLRREFTFCAEFQESGKKPRKIIKSD